MCHICRSLHIVFGLSLQIGAVISSMNVAREASGVVCSCINFTYPYLPPQAPTTYVYKKLRS